MANIPPSALRPADLILRDYSHQLILVGAQVNLIISWHDKEITVPVYLHSDVAGGKTCLLGTNVVIPLGLITPGEGVEAAPLKREGSTPLVASVNLIGQPEYLADLQ